MELLSVLTSTQINWNNQLVVTFFTVHLSKSETIFLDEIFKAFHTYVELNTHQWALAKSSPFPSYVGLSYDSPLLTALVLRFVIK